jgi:hypothetical protein
MHCNSGSDFLVVNDKLYVLLGKWRQSCLDFNSSGRLLWALPASLSVFILIYSCNIYFGHLLTTCPLTQRGKTVVCFVAEKGPLVAVMASASGLDWSNTPYFLLIQMWSSADSLSHTCSIFAEFHVYINCIIPYTVSTAIVPQTYV